MNGKGSSRACLAVRIISEAQNRKWTVSSLKGRGRVCLVVYAQLLQHKLLGRDEKEQMQIGHVCFTIVIITTLNPQNYHICFYSSVFAA